ncbi:unnamed protein product [Urochloa decumbens]|uniref:Uncharacterized protein n=1 Tax=Urochloa decumbens TaxID=240449 RepID=A0ABC9H5Z3_9POAL
MGKGKVHPSPSLPAAAGGGELTAEAVLMRLLPAAVLAAAASLGAEGKEVLAYLVLSSLRSSAPPTPARGEAAAGGHRPELGCGCFGCYTAYWSRWDGSPEDDREAIHRAIEAFEEHLTKEEKEAGGKGGGGTRRGRKKRAAAAVAAAADKDAAAGKEKSGKGKGKGKDKGKGKGKEVAVDPLPLPLPLPPPPPASPAPEEAPKAEDGADYLTAEEEKEPEDAATTSAAGEEEKRRRGWGGVLSWRSWGLWGSH